MKKFFLNIYRCIVGPESGFTGEGNEQWYYFLSLVINLTLIWWQKPEIGLVFTILAVIHYVTVAYYGISGLYDVYDDGCTTKQAYVYLGIHLLLLVIAMITSFKWAIITTIITIIAFFLAPDCTGNNIFLRKKSYSILTLLFNTMIFAAFVIIVFLLPIKLWTKLLMIIGALVIHPVIDYLEGECIIISDVTYGIFEIIKSSVKKQKKR